jgi:succinate dehydrogenase hydrophobic anchor subunit
MADQQAAGFPWTSMVVVAAFVSSTLLVPRAFEQLRPAERERAQPEQLAQLEVEARLWEDPFIAARRYEAERARRCAEGGANGKAAPRTSPAGPPECAEQLSGTRLRQWRDTLLRDDVNGNAATEHGAADTLVVAALAQGHPFVGAEENRRRMRYALLAGLQAKGYVPVYPERMGLLDLSMGAPAAASARRLLVPYEVLVPRRLQRGDEQRQTAAYRKVTVLWVNETGLQAPKLDSLGWLLHGALSEWAPGKRPRLDIIGPSSSDALRTALKDLRDAADKRKVEQVLEAARPAPARSRAAVARGRSAPAQEPKPWAAYELLAGAEILSPFATASNRQIHELAGQRLEDFIGERLNVFRTPIPLERPETFRRLIATDNEVIRQLVSEIQRRLPPKPRRVVLVAERDSLYAQALAAELTHQLKEQLPTVSKVEVRYYFRGIDGVTTRDTEPEDKPQAGKPADGDKDKPGKSASNVEWPEGRDQLDYLRRLAGSLQDSEASEPPASRASEAARQARLGPIGAIGIVGSDVHDKLLVLQALRESFSDKVFFTTDMDARYLHPKALPFSRNLLVASSLPLQMPADVQRGTPAFRDAYQTATYLAARRAGCLEESCKRDEEAIAGGAIREPSVYEIGRTRAVPLAGFDFANSRLSSSHTRALVAALFVMLLAGALIAWPSTPALRRARDRVFGAPAPGRVNAALPLSVVLLVALHLALQVYAIGSAAELTHPRLLGFNTIMFMSAVAACATLAGLYAVSRGQPPAPQRPGTGSRPKRVGGYNAALSSLLVAVLAGGFLWMAWPSGNGAACADCEPVFWFEGVSAWPSHLIHVLVLLAIVCALDHAWNGARHSVGDLCGSVYKQTGGAQQLESRRVRRAVAYWFSHCTLAGWRPVLRPCNPPPPASGGPTCCNGADQRLMSLDADELGQDYLHRAQTSARIGRVLFWYVVTVALMALLFFGLSEGYVPEVPVRGDDHRRLVANTLYAVLLLLPLLVVAVADDTMLACRFIWHLSRGRSLYHPLAVWHHARVLGGERAQLWMRGLCLRPADRTGGDDRPMRPEDRAADGTPVKYHTLLDDWIDIQVVAQITQRVAPLIIWPFVVLALLIVARSRLFDNWALTVPIALGAGAYLIWLVVLAVALKQSSEHIRQRSLARMKEDLRWLQGSSAEWKELAQPFEGLIEAVESHRTGAFANLFDQPLFKALLVPLGTAGGAHWIEWLLLGRA